MRVAESSINGSVIGPAESLKEKLDAIELWDSKTGYSSSFSEWIQKTRSGIDFEMTTVNFRYDVSESVKKYNKMLFENNFPNTNLGIEWKEIGERLTKKLELALEIPNQWKKGNTFRGIKLSNEFDFQNLVEQVIKPWLPSLEREAVVAKYDGQEKNIDFTINWNRILIEAKHIKDANTEAKALKEIIGVMKFYESNTRVQLLLFWTLIEKGYHMDIHKIESDLSDFVHSPIILVKFFYNN